LSDLTEANEGLELVTQMSEAQEVALANHPKILLVTYLLLNDWKFHDIVSAFQMDENELIDILLRLDRLKIIEYRPPHRDAQAHVEKLHVAKGRPVHNFFVNRFAPEYFRSAFAGPGDAFRFVGGTLSAESLAQFKASLERLAIEFENWRGATRACPSRAATGCSAILTVRSWSFPSSRAYAAQCSQRIVAEQVTRAVMHAVLQLFNHFVNIIVYR